MPLYSIDNGQATIITRIPHISINLAMIKRIAAQDLKAIRDELNRRVDAVVNTSDELITSGWIPGKDWTNTVWEPIYVASRNNISLAGMVFGTLLFEVMMNRSENWSLGKYQVNDRDIGSTTYFRIL